MSESRQNQIFKADSLINNAPAGIAIDGYYTQIRSQHFRAYTTIFLEPPTIIKNCLPFSILVELEGKKSHDVRKITHVLEPQDQWQVVNFSPDYSVSMHCSVEAFKSSEYLLRHTDQKPQKFFLYYHNKRVHLDIQTPRYKSDFISRHLIIARACVINESNEELDFYACNENSAWVSPFSIQSGNGNEIVIFDNISMMKIKPKCEGSSLSDFISLNRLGVTTADVFDGKKRILNLSILVTNVLCGRFILLIWLNSFRP